MQLKFTLLLLALCSPFYLTAQYCNTSSTTNCGYEAVNNVTFESINNTSGCSSGAYADYTGTDTAFVYPGLTYSLSVTIDVDGSDYVTVWIDWNANTTFELSEQYVLATSTSSAGPFTTNVTVPSTAAIGFTRLRAVVRWLETPNPCTSTYSYGETEDYTVSVLPPPLTIVAQASYDLSCYGDVVDIPTATVGGVMPYTYLWNTGSTNDTIFGVGGGTYSCVVTDDNGDTDTVYVAVNEPDSISTSTAIDSTLVCNYDMYGVVSVIASGGSPNPSLYSIDTITANYNPDNSQTGTAVNLGDDALSVALPIGFDFEFFGQTFSNFYIGSNGYITFDNGFSSYEQTLPSGTAPNNVIALVWEDLYPPGGGAISYYTIGTAPNQVLIVNFEDIPYWPNNTADVTVQAKLFQSTGCIEIHTTYAGFSTSAETQTQGIENGSGTVAYTYPERNNTTWTTQGSYISFCPDTIGLTYEWSSGHTTYNAYGLNEGMYTVTVTDANGCSKLDSVALVAASSLVSADTITDISCFGFNDGMINPMITGGVLPMTYAWSNSEITPSVSNVMPGTYAVTAEDAVGCTIVVDNLVVWEPTILISAITQVEGVVCPGDTTGSASGVASGGVSPYIYSWMPGGMSGQSATGLTNGSYNLKVVDANGCQSYTSATILASSTTPVVDLGDDIFDPNGGTHILNAGSHATYAWSGGGSGATKEVTTSGTYKVTVTNEDGCTATDEIVVEIWPTGVNEVKGAHFNVYPNPAVAVINIEFGSALTNSTVNIVDVKGAVVSSVALNDSGLQTISVESIPAGVYTVSVVSGESVTTHKLVISR